MAIKTIIHINQHIIKSNRKYGQNQPAITVKTYKSTRYAHSVKINGPSTVVYNAIKPLSCGAHAWIETHSDVEVL